MVVTTNAPAGTSPWSVPPLATFPVGFQLIGQNGLRVPASMLNADLFLSAIGEASSGDLFFSSTGAESFPGVLFNAADAGFASAASRTGAVRIDIQIKEKNFFIVSQ